MLKILQQFVPDFPERGFSIDEMMAVFKNHIHGSDIKIMVILEKAEVLINNDGIDLIYLLKNTDNVSLLFLTDVPSEEILEKLAYCEN